VASHTKAQLIEPHGKTDTAGGPVAAEQVRAWADTLMVEL